MSGSRARRAGRIATLATLAATATLATTATAGPNPEQEYGTHGFLDPVSKGTEEVDHCEPRTGVAADELTTRAADHYDRGVVLYEQGDYQGAIREFVVGYCDKPDVSMFYNIGQTYERLLDYEKAVAYLERFIVEAPEGAANRKRASLRVEVLRNLPARIRVATVPPAAKVTLSSDTGVTAEEVANADEPIRVRKGTYTMRIELAGYEPIEQEVVAEIGQPYSYYFRLEPEKGVLRIVASPGDARIFVDARLAGIGNYVETVPIGTYQLAIEAEGRPAAKRTIVVRAGKTTDVSISLGEKPSSGKLELVIAAGLASSVASGSVGATLFNQSAASSSLVGLAGLGLGLGGAYFGAPADIPVGHSSYLIGTTLVGIGEGLAVSNYFACAHSATAITGCNDNAIAGTTLATGLAGLLFGALTVGRFDPDAGDAALVNSGAQWGVATGLLFYAVFDQDQRILEPAAFAGLNIGLVVGSTLASRSTVSRGRVALIDLSGLGGLLGGVAIGQAFSSTDERLAHFALVGMASGLIAGTYLTRNIDEPKVLGTLRPQLGVTENGTLIVGGSGDL